MYGLLQYLQDGVHHITTTVSQENYNKIKNFKWVDGHLYPAKVICVHESPEFLEVISKSLRGIVPRVELENAAIINTFDLDSDDSIKDAHMRSMKTVMYQVLIWTMNPIIIFTANRNGFKPSKFQDEQTLVVESVPVQVDVSIPETVEVEEHFRSVEDFTLDSDIYTRSKDRRKILETIRRNGDYMHNTYEEYNSGTLLVSRRPKADRIHLADDITSCSECDTNESSVPDSDEDEDYLNSRNQITQRRLSSNTLNMDTDMEQIKTVDTTLGHSSNVHLEDSVSKTTKNKRKHISGCTRFFVPKKSWSPEEKEIVEKAFSDCFVNGKLTSHKRVESFISSNSGLKLRSPQSVRLYIRNQLVKRKSTTPVGPNPTFMEKYPDSQSKTIHSIRTAIVNERKRRENDMG
ncbi:hypothetical protein RN001_005607 [Aquatica leii]|uniref:Uncharacterized protein n=1 Tax=Aquatica leii TaxID=1421715 RepID=A0AAN7QKF9_9COLE|nr:hypothetical protein RN001_005607 [Aquatica leii]